MYTVDKFVWYLVKTKQHTFIADSHSVVYHILINPVIRIADMVTITMIHLCDSGSMLVTSASVETCSIVPFDQPPEATYPESCSYVCMLKWSWSHYWHIFPTPDLSPATCHDDHDHPPTGDMYQCPTGGHRYWSPDPMRHGHGHHPPLLTCPPMLPPLASLQPPEAGWGAREVGTARPPLASTDNQRPLKPQSEISNSVPRTETELTIIRTLVTSGASWLGSWSSLSSGQLTSSGNSS